MSKSNSSIALALLCGVFFAWGFLTSINSILVPYAQQLFKLSMTQSMLIQSVFYTSPLLVCLPTVFVIKGTGYRKALMISLMLIVLGGLCAMFAFHTTWFALLLTAIFIIACGVAMLQVIANPYVVALGESHSAPQRLTFASTINSLGTTVAPYFTAHLLFSDNTQPNMDVALYAGITGFMILLCLAIRAAKMPEPQAKLGDQQTCKLFDHRHLVFGIVAIFCYTGAETSIASLLVSYLSSYGGLQPSSAAQMVALYWGGAMIGRLIGTALFSTVNARLVLIINALTAVAVTAFVAVNPGVSSAYLLIAVGLLNSIMYPVIFSLAVDNLGSYTEKASGFLVMAGLGGATIPLLQTALSSAATLNVSFLLPAACYGFILLFATSLYRPEYPVTEKLTNG